MQVHPKLAEAAGATAKIDAAWLGRPRLAALTTAVPPHVLEQSDVASLAERLFDRRRSEIERLRPVFANTGIDRRYSCVPLDWYLGPCDWEDRARLYLENALELLERAARSCLERAGLRPEDIDMTVTVSTTGIATPSLDARLMERLPFRRALQRLPVFGLGCAGGALGLGRAAALARAEPGTRVLLLVVELCGLTFRKADQSKSNIVATALFGDGAAAALISSHPQDGGPAITGWGEHTWPDSLDVMGWTIRDDGLGVRFSRDIPRLVREDYGAATDSFLDDQGLTRADLDGQICHPGGTKVIEALEQVFELPPGSLDEARAVLRDYGNMSAATVLFVLERHLAKGLAGRHLLSALGPGFTAGFALLEGTR